VKGGAAVKSFVRHLGPVLVLEDEFTSGFIGEVLISALMMDALVVVTDSGHTVDPTKATP
jgi:hypothetical protein